MDGASAAYDGIVSLIDDPKLSDNDKLRLVLLYALRYERDAGRVGPLVERLSSSGVERDKVRLVRTMLLYAGANQRSGDLYGQKQGFFSRSQSYMTRSLKVLIRSRSFGGTFGQASTAPALFFFFPWVAIFMYPCIHEAIVISWVGFGPCHDSSGLHMNPLFSSSSSSSLSLSPSLPPSLSLSRAWKTSTRSIRQQFCL